MIYLASPYTNDPEGNYVAMLDVCKRLVSRTPTPLVFSPVVYFHTFAQGVPYEQVMDMCFKMLSHASIFVVVALPGWSESKGVKAESLAWHGTGGKAKLMDPKTLQVIPQ